MASKRARTVLITGFPPFGGAKVNPSERAVTALAGRVIEGRTIVAEVLPCTFADARGALARAVRRHRPELVVCVGEAAGRVAITPERVAINVDDARIEDNAGARPVDRAVVRGGPVGYWSSLPIKAIVAALHAASIPASVSQTAGTFVCNHVFYALMHQLARIEGVRGGFVHVPSLADARVGSPGMSLDTIVRGLEIVIATSLVTRRDLRTSGGATQ